MPYPKVSIPIVRLGRVKAIQETRRTAQPGQPARVRPAATQFEDTGGQTQVSNCQTRPSTGRLSVLHFKTREAQPEQIPLMFLVKY